MTSDTRARIVRAGRRLVHGLASRSRHKRPAVEKVAPGCAAPMSAKSAGAPSLSSLSLITSSPSPSPVESLKDRRALRSSVLLMALVGCVLFDISLPTLFGEIFPPTLFFNLR